ncbi:MAG: GNAT family N-acetyltransferase [Alphaproteobacteria bacterium]|nr:GNAT family N-acetyltransferase [Alphaproteobacteria bacterium]OJV13748.1 MAG: hypothetical protein BGO27_01455 [Alphaproteobacteria bacterium 33-17]
MANINLKILDQTHLKTLENLWQFYIYSSSDFLDAKLNENGLYNEKDLSGYFNNPAQKAYIIMLDDEIAGFALLNQKGILESTDWRLDHFFVMHKFHGKGIAKAAVHELWKLYKGNWELTVVPTNTKALAFWHKNIEQYTSYKCDYITVDYDPKIKERWIFTFNNSL